MWFGYSVLSSFITAIIATTLTHPADRFKVRHMTGVSSMWELRNCFNGLSLNLLRVVPHFMIVMIGIEYFKA